jgi:hypothetical protein
MTTLDATSFLSPSKPAAQPTKPVKLATPRARLVFRQASSLMCRP